MRAAVVTNANAFGPDAVERALGRPPARVLIAGPDRAGLAAMWSGSRRLIQHVPETSDLERSPGPWDAILVNGALERERWDRWLVQRVHRLLAPGGLLVAAVPHLMDVWSMKGIAYIGRGAWRQARRRWMSRGALPAADRSAFRGRRYALRALLAMVEGVGFEVVSQTSEGHGLGPFAGILGPGAPRTARRLVITARKLPSVWGSGRPFPECAAVLASFRERHASDLASREAWAAHVGSRAALAEAPLEEWARGGAVVLAPHPDDEVIGCGGTLLDLVARQGRITIVQVTDGSDSAAFITETEAERRRVRLDEAREVARRIGAEVVCLEADNRKLRATPELTQRMREVLERTGARVAFAPSFTDIHPDHQVVLHVLADALNAMTGSRPDVALYEVWSVVSPTHAHDVEPRIHDIEQLLLAYETALKIDDYVHLVAERLLFNSCEHRGRPGYLETFHVLGADRFLTLAAEHFAGRSVP